MKKKILSLLMCICVAFGCLFSFAGCSLVKDNNNLADGEKIVLTINDTTYDKDEIVSSFYNFIYQNYALIYNGTESSIIEEKFYNSFVKNKIVMQKANEALESGDIHYCEEDENDVWKSVEDYFRSQINSYEKDLYDNDEEKYPIWLQTEENEEESELFKPYEDPSIKDDEDKGSDVEKLTREDIEKEDNDGNSKYNQVFKAMFNYVSSIEKDENDEEIKTYTEIKDQEAAQTRRNAYARYMENLVLNAKAEGKQTTAEELLLDQIVDVYDSYYDAKIAEIFQKYYEETLVLDANELTNDSIVKTFLQSYNADKQNFLNEADYISVITGKDTEVILYHNNDKFFTVQHILLKFDDALVSLIKEDPFYVDMASSDLQLELYEQFMKNREEIVENYYPENIGVLTDLNEDQIEKSITNGTSPFVIDGYYDYYTYSEVDGYKKVEATVEGAKKMATAEQIINCYNYNLNHIIMPRVQAVLMDKANLAEQEEEIKYILEAVLNIKESRYPDLDIVNGDEIPAEIIEKISSLVFIELSWIFSDDGLYNTIYKQLGYVMANYPDDNNNFTHEFVDLSKNLYKAIVENKTLDISDVSVSNNLVITKDGLHIIKLDNVFEQGTSLIDVSGIKESDYTSKTEYYSAVADLMKQTYICNGSTQTVYDYYRDLIYSNLAGDDSTTGSYFEDVKNGWLQEYLKDNKISYNEKLSYEEIMSELY